MRYPGDDLETEEEFRASEARYELEQEARERRTDPVYAMRQPKSTRTILTELFDD